jgi:hypothetical protein
MFLVEFVLNLYCYDTFDENMKLSLASVTETLVVTRVTYLSVMSSGKLMSVMIFVTYFGPLYEHNSSLSMCLLGTFVTYALSNYLIT